MKKVKQCVGVNTGRWTGECCSIESGGDWSEEGDVGGEGSRQLLISAWCLAGALCHSLLK